MPGFYEPLKIYEISVVDMLSPEASMFVCGLNGIVKELPTRRPVKLTGAEINMLMNCCIPQVETRDVEGLRKIVGRSEYPRFAITQRDMGVMPTSRAVILDPYKDIQTIQPEKKVVEKPLTAEELEVMEEPGPDREDQLDAATRPELVILATEMGIEVGPRTGRETIIRAILKEEKEVK